MTVGSKNIEKAQIIAHLANTDDTLRHPATRGRAWTAQLRRCLAIGGEDLIYLPRYQEGKVAINHHHFFLNVLSSHFLFMIKLVVNV